MAAFYIGNHRVRLTIEDGTVELKDMSDYGYKQQLK